MKILLLLALISLSFAQFEQFDAKILQCEKDCCTNHSGVWNDECSINDSRDYNDYLACDNKCLEGASREMQSYGYSGCCAPAFIFLAIGMLMRYS